MALEENIEAIYQRAVSNQEGSAWKFIRDTRDSVRAEIKANVMSMGYDNRLKAEMNKAKEKDPKLSNQDVFDVAMEKVVEQRTHDSFVTKFKEKATENGAMASISNIVDLAGKFLTLLSGSFTEKFAVLKSGFSNDLAEIGDAWNDYRASGGKKTLFSALGEHARNASIANWLGITNSTEKKQFLADLTAEKPVLVARAIQASTPDQIEAARAERERLEQENREGKPTAAGGQDVSSNNPPKGTPKSEVPSGKKAAGK